jgi:hypothetical protein
MSILLSGDFHANSQNELNSITKKSLIQKYRKDKYNKIKYHIILGDAGFMWLGNHKSDLFNYEVLAKRPFPLLCIVGNHEPILGMSDLYEADIGIGESVYQIQTNPFVAYLKRGKIYTIDDFKFLVLGGALSVDKDFRKPNISWWEREYWSEQEKENVFQLLEKANVFDCVLSHTGPQHINKILFEYLLSSYSNKFEDDVALLNDEIHQKIQFDEWWCGHWHVNKYKNKKKTNHGYQYLYKETKILDKIDSKMIVYNEHGMSKR